MSGSCGMQAKGNPAIKSERKAPAVARVRAAKAPSETQGPRTRYDEAKRRFRVHRAISTARYHMEVNQWRTPLMPSTKGRENANMSCRGVMSQDCGHPRTRTWRSGYLSCRAARVGDLPCGGARLRPASVLGAEIPSRQAIRFRLSDANEVNRGVGMALGSIYTGSCKGQ